MIRLSVRCLFFLYVGLFIYIIYISIGIIGESSIFGFGGED